MNSLRVRPLHVGTITRPMSTFCHGLNPHVSMEAPLICWYIEGSSKRILVDTGGDDPSVTHEKLLPYKREEDNRLENGLKRLGVGCEDIDIVIMTHLHWDHCGGIGLFPNAEIIVQAEELQAARSPFPIWKHAYVKDIAEKTNYSVISGDKEIVKGVQVILTPGHTYGLQGVLVEGKNRRVFIAGDTFGLFRNLEENPPLLSGVFVDVRKYYESMEKIAKLSAFILPGHDFAVFEKKVYESL